MHHANLVRITNRREPVCNHDRRTVTHQVLQSLLHQAFRLGVERRSRLVEDQDRRVLQNGTCNTDTLALSARQLTAAVTDISIVSIFACHDKIMRIGDTGRLLDLFECSPFHSERDIIEKCVVKKNRLLVDIPHQAAQIVQGRIIPEVMVTSTEANQAMLEGRQVVAMGPGLGRTCDVPDFVDSILDSYEGPLVLDADALYALGHVGSVDKDALRDGEIESVYMVERDLPYCVMTPHLGEFSRLIDLPIKWIERHYITLARAFAKAHQVVLVLKGIPSVVALPDGTVYINTIGNAGMGTGGMGDVLTGVIAGFVSQGYSLQDSAVLGVYVHSRSADILSDTKSWGYTPSDVSASLGCVISELLGE